MLNYHVCMTLMFDVYIFGRIFVDSHVAEGVCEDEV